MVRALLQKSEDLSSNPQNQCKKPGVASHMLLTPVTWAVATGELVGLAGCRLVLGQWETLYRGNETVIGQGTPC